MFSWRQANILAQLIIDSFSSYCTINKIFKIIRAMLHFNVLEM